MPHTRQLEKIRKGTHGAFIAVFVCLLWLPALDSLFHWDKARVTNENRAPAKFPAFNLSLGGVRNYLTGLEGYYNDHFGFRKQLIRWNHRWRHHWFKESSLSDVIIGREGWLFYCGDHMIENYRGMAQFQPKALQEWQALLEARRDWLAQRGIRYLFVVAPNKDSVYPEYVPEWMTKVRPTTKLDQFLTFMRTNSTVEILELRPVLLEAKQSCPTYLFTDTHWNSYGAFAAHQELVRTLSRQLPGLTPLSLDSFEKRTEMHEGGDLALMLGQQQSLPEKDCPSFSPRPPLRPYPISTHPKLLPGKKWGQFKEPVISENPNCSGKAIIFRDSFSGGWLPFLGFYFNKVIYLWEYSWEPAFIEQEKPDVVIDEMLERFLYGEHPDELKSLDGLR